MTRLQTAILISRDRKSYIDEAISLCDTAGYTIIQKVTRNLSQRSKYGLGEGTVDKLELDVKKLNPDVIFYNGLLKPSQNYNLASRLQLKILDRTALVLEIFERRASSDESQLQVKLAQMRYEMVHAKEKVRLSKMGEQPGFMGIGKFEVDVYYNDIRHRMQTVRAKLERASSRRKLHRDSRSRLGLHTISLAGYTSSGKTTLFNALTGEDRERSSNLFTTLVTTVRRAEFNGIAHLVTDTVGFIGNMPAYLVDAFKSTLEEMTFADAIILVVDASDETEIAMAKLQNCQKTLGELDVQPGRVIIALNKADLITRSELDMCESSLGLERGSTVRISAVTGSGLDDLKKLLMRIIGTDKK